MKAILNGQWVDLAEQAMTQLPASVPGVFETVLWRDGQPVFWEAHWARFAAGCRWFSIHPPFEPGGLIALAEDVASENGVRCGVMRFAAWAAAVRGTEWRLEIRPPRPHMHRSALTVTAGPALPQARPENAFKHLGRTAWSDALKRARDAGFDEVLLCDATGLVVEGAVSNVFFTRGGQLHTAPLDLGALPGVMRAELLRLAASSGEPVRETATTIEDLGQADEVWLTNSLMGIKPVEAIDRRGFSVERPCLERMRARFTARFGWDPTYPCGPV
jgi:branched-subunit amino acid aminotransferase/4-amino-4-deoxychorismate lyase